MLHLSHLPSSAPPSHRTHKHGTNCCRHISCSLSKLFGILIKTLTLSILFIYSPNRGLSPCDNVTKSEGIPLFDPLCNWGSTTIFTGFTRIEDPCHMSAAHCNSRHGHEGRCGQAIHYTPHAGGGAGVHDLAGCYMCRLPEQTGAALRATMARTGTWHLTPVVTTVQPWHNHTQLTQLSRDSQDNNRSASAFFSPTLNTPDTARNRTTLNGSSCECLNLIVPLSGNSYTFYN